MFVDRVRVYVKGGDGGNGVTSFLREKYRPHGGPDGGDGGRGGSVVFTVDEGLRTLLDFKYQQHIKGSRGQHGKGKKSHGKNAPDMEVKVPAGTVVYNDETGEKIADLTRPGEKAVIARGGRGGRGNARFASPTRKAPRLSEKGEPGEELRVIIELKLMADVGLVGFPNAGKSTFLSRVSAARPRVAAYPFTTLSPNLGEVQVAKEESFVLADIPGIIEGAHRGTGLGLQFLRHIERTRVLLFLLDAAGTEGRDPLEDYRNLHRELDSYSKTLTQKPRIIAANKIDLPEGKKNLEIIKNELGRDYPVFAVSAVTGEGIEDLLYFALEKIKQVEGEIELEEIVKERDKKEERKVYKYEPQDKFIIEFDGEAYRVKGETIERYVHMTDFDNEEALLRLQRYFDRSGVEEALREKGVKEGDLVRIGKMEFNYSREGI